MSRHVQLAAALMVLGAFACPRFAEAQAQRIPSRDTLVLSQQEARRIGLESSPTVRAALAAAERGRGLGSQARAYPFNPSFQLDATSLIQPGRTAPLEAVLWQEVEWAGQWLLRRRSGGYQQDVATEQGRDALRGALLEIDLAYLRALTAERRLEVRAEGSQLAQRFLDAVESQARLGKVSSLEVNLASIESGRAEAGERSASRERTVALLELRRVLGLALDQPIRLPREDGPGAEPPPLDVQALVARALEARPDLRAATADLERARAERSLANRLVIPNLTVGAAANRDELREATRWGIKLGLPMPLWNRSGGLRDAAAAEESRAAAARAGAELRVRTEVLAAVEAYRSAREELALLEERVLAPAQSNQRLLETAYEAGRLDLPTVLLLRGQLLDAELEYWNAWLIERSAQATLQAAIGETP